MSRNWESWLQSATGPASNTEEADRDRTERQIRDVIDRHPQLAGNVRVFTKGSYANSTNVRRDSDVDIAVEWTRWWRLSKYHGASDLSWDELGENLTSDGPTAAEFRGWVETALVDVFGSGSVDVSGNKAITVAGGSTTLDADVVPCFLHKQYVSPTAPPRVGIRLEPAIGQAINNWPEQNYENGVAKNRSTNRKYKELVRSLKRLENDMVEVGRLPEEVHGYFIESLLFNLPDSAFGAASYTETVLDVLAKLWTSIDQGQHDDWVEVNDIKWLWRSGQTWTPEEASRFAYQGWNYIKGN